MAQTLNVISVVSQTKHFDVTTRQPAYWPALSTDTQP